MIAKTLSLLFLLLLSGCDKYECNIEPVEKYPIGSLVEYKQSGEVVRVIEHWIPLGGGKKYACESGLNPTYTVRFPDGAEVALEHNDLMLNK